MTPTEVTSYTPKLGATATRLLKLLANPTWEANARLASFLKGAADNAVGALFVVTDDELIKAVYVHASRYPKANPANTAPAVSWTNAVAALRRYLLANPTLRVGQAVDTIASTLGLMLEVSNDNFVRAVNALTTDTHVCLGLTLVYLTSPTADYQFGTLVDTLPNRVFVVEHEGVRTELNGDDFGFMKDGSATYIDPSLINRFRSYLVEDLTDWLTRPEHDQLWFERENAQNELWATDPDVFLESVAAGGPVPVHPLLDGPMTYAAARLKGISPLARAYLFYAVSGAWPTDPRWFDRPAA